MHKNNINIGVEKLNKSDINSNTEENVKTKELNIKTIEELNETAQLKYGYTTGTCAAIAAKEIGRAHV